MPEEIEKILTREKTYNPEKGPLASVSNQNLPKFLLELPFDSKKPEVAEASRNIFDIGTEYCFDGGCAGGPIALYTEYLPPITENGVNIFNRSAFLTYIEEHYGDVESARQHVAFEIIDIKDFRSADMVRSPNGENGAEIVLRRFSRELTGRADKINLQLASLGIVGAKVVVARYGGDEFAILYENIPDEIPNNLNEEWIERCEGHTSFREVVRNYLTGEHINENGERETDIKGIFQRDDLAALENVKLKNDDAGAFEITSDPDKARIFWERLQKGLVLREEEIITPPKQNEQTVNPTQTEFISSLAGEERTQEEIKINIDRIAGQNPKLRSMIDSIAVIANSFGSDNDPEANRKRNALYAEFEEFLRNTVCDRLLSGNVETMRSFAETEMSTPFRRIHVIEASGLKETNDNYGLQAGDDLIKALWDRVNTCTTNPDGSGEISGVRFFRRGSTILICETDSSDLNEIQQNQLAGIKSVKFLVGEREIEVPVGYSSITPEQGYVPKTTEEIRTMVERLFNSEKRNMEERLVFQEMRRLGENVFSNDTNLLELSTPNEQIKNGDSLIGLGNFYLIYLFGGKRSEERTTFALGTLNEVINGVLNNSRNVQELGREIGIEREYDTTSDSVYRNSVLARLTAMRSKIEQAKMEKLEQTRA